MDFVFDLDGTLCFHSLPISTVVAKELENLKSQGNRIIFASARPIRDMLPVLPKEFHEDPLIGGNGALISKGKRIDVIKVFSKRTWMKLKELIKEYNVTYLIDGDWNYAYTGPENHPILKNLDPDSRAKQVNVEQLTSILKILLLTFKEEERLTQELSQLELTMHYHQNENIIDLSPSGINKWNALQHLGVKENTFVAFGNDANDISMFQHAKRAIMVGYHKELSCFATDELPLENVEAHLTQTLRSFS